MEKRVEQGVAHFLDQVGRTGIAHERRTGMAADHRAGKARGNVDAARAGLGHVHALVEAAEYDQRRVAPDRVDHRLIVGLDPGRTREGEMTRQAHIGLEEVADAARVGFGRDDAEARGTEEILRDGAPQVP